MAIARLPPVSAEKLKRRISALKINNMEQFLLEHTREFCDKTSIHGLRYVTEKGCHWLQSLIWGAFIILGGIFCVILMYLVWSRFSTNPTITAVETINYPVWNVPFPSVTICDVNKVNKPKIKRIEDILLSNKISKTEANEFFASLSYLINSRHFTKAFVRIFEILDDEGVTVGTLMIEVMQRCQEMLKKCTWMGDEIDCWKLFKTIKTDEGFCCSFNYHHSNESFDRANESQASEYRDKVYYTAGAGIHTGLNIVISVDESNYLSSTRLVPAIIVLVHDNLDYPEIRTLGTLVQIGQLVNIPVEPSFIDTTDDVKTLHYTKRNCTFDDEESISIGAYGYENCVIECRMDAIVELCGCIPFYYNVHYYKNRTVPFCKLHDADCIKKNYRLLYTLQSSDDSHITNSSFGLNCRCFPTCDVNWYDYSTDMGDMVDAESENYNMSKIISLHVYFMEFSCLKYKQSNLITWDGLFASFGGIFGLCLGGSILSVVEVFYHFTIRLYMSYTKRLDSENAANKQKIFTDSKWKQDIFISDFVQTYKHLKISPNFNNHRDLTLAKKTSFKFKKANVKPINVDRILYAISYPQNKK